MSEIGTRLDALRAMFGDEGFLQNKGLSNEVGLYIFAYPPEEEMAVRAFVREIRAEYAGEQDKCRVIIYDLYEILLDICRERRILDRIGQMEKQRGQEFMRQQIQRIAPPQATSTCQPSFSRYATRPSLPPGYTLSAPFPLPRESSSTAPTAITRTITAAGSSFRREKHSIFISIPPDQPMRAAPGICTQEKKHGTIG